MKYNPIDIKCPNCGSLAKFEEPFEFFTSYDTELIKNRPYHKWAGWIVVERFPSQVNWKEPSGPERYLRESGGDLDCGGYPLLTNGLITCFDCHFNKKHKLTWPQDAYWKWEIRGKILWAWDRRQAKKILSHVKQKTRASRVAPSLRYVPSFFLSSKLRDLVIKRIEQSLKA